MKKIKVLIIAIILFSTLFLSGCNEQTNNKNNETSEENEINLRPIANASAIPTNGSAPLNVYFYSNGSYDPDGKIVSYKWHLGQDKARTDSNQNPKHTYFDPGNYTIALFVQDDDGAWSNASFVNITVS